MCRTQTERARLGIRLCRSGKDNSRQFSGENEPCKFQEKKALLAEADYGRLSDRTLDGRRSPGSSGETEKHLRFSGCRCTVCNLRFAKDI